MEYQSTVANLKKKLNNYDGTLIALSAHVHIPQAVQEALLSVDKATYSSGLVKLQTIVQESLEQSAEAQQNYTQRENEKTIRELTDKLNTASTLHNDDVNTLRTRLDNALLEVSTSKQKKIESANEVKQLQLKIELQNKEIASLHSEIEREKQLAQMQIQDVKERAETDIAHLKATLDAESSFQSSKLPDIISIFSFLFVS